jgi:hypothetical protein
VQDAHALEKSGQAQNPFLTVADHVSHIQANAKVKGQDLVPESDQVALGRVFQPEPGSKVRPLRQQA